MAARKMVSRVGADAAMDGLLQMRLHRTVRVFDPSGLNGSQQRLRRVVSAVRQGGVEPRSGDGPVALGGRLGDAQAGGCFLERETGEVAQLHEFGLDRFLLGEAV